MTLSFHHLRDIPVAELVTLLNDKDVRRHMPLAGGHWDEKSAAAWAVGKDAQWVENGYGPWAIRLDGVFAGWGGFQKEGDDVDLGVVLLPAFWGHGKAILESLLERGFLELGFASVTILLPPSRVRLKSLFRLGFVADGEVIYRDERFLKFRLHRPEG